MTDNGLRICCAKGYAHHNISFPQSKIVDFDSEFSLRVLAKSTILWFKARTQVLALALKTSDGHIRLVTHRFFYLNNSM